MQNLTVVKVDTENNLIAVKGAVPGSKGTIITPSAIREASTYNITVKGGKYLEAMAEADTIVFDIHNRRPRAGILPHR